MDEIRWIRPSGPGAWHAIRANSLGDPKARTLCSEKPPADDGAILVGFDDLIEVRACPACELIVKLKIAADVSEISAQVSKGGRSPRAEPGRPVLSFTTTKKRHDA